MDKKKTTCDTCAYYVWDEDYECYTCDSYLDEDEVSRLMSDEKYRCPYYRNGDDYKVVRSQM